MVPEPGEQVFFHEHPSWMSMPALYIKGLLSSLIVGVLAGLASAVASGRVQSTWVIVAVLAVFTLVSLRGYTRRMRTTYTITDRRVRIGTGLLSRDVLETRLDRVQHANARQSLLERLLGVGTVDFETAGGADYGFSFRGVSDPRDIVRTIDDVLQERDGIAPWH
jgi:uncharacterized membrane protein YdbT with pleckstrin-like domain